MKTQRAQECHPGMNKWIYLIFSRIRLRLTGEDETETKYMQWYTYFLLLIVYVIYLAFGAVVFQAIEQPAEVRSSSWIQNQAALFLNDWF